MCCPSMENTLTVMNYHSLLKYRDNFIMDMLISVSIDG